MRFDVILANPPYLGKAQMHHKFFNKAVELCKDDGTVGFIQPATPYFSKKPSRSIQTKMRKNLSKYETAVTILPNTVFPDAKVLGDLAVTVLEKKDNPSGLIKSVTYKNNKTAYDVDIININYLSMDHDVYSSLSSKYDNYIKKHGSLLDMTYRKQLAPHITSIAGLQKVRGHFDNADFFTFISNNERYWTKDISERASFGIHVSNNNQLKNVYSYLTLYVARFGLALRKFNTNNHMGEFAKVPLVDFDNKYNDKQLCEMLGITEIEYSEILNVIAPYHE